MTGLAPAARDPIARGDAIGFAEIAARFGLTLDLAGDIAATGRALR